VHRSIAVFESVTCRAPADRFACSRVARLVAAAAGFGAVEAAEVGTAAAELASNVVRHGGGGVLEVRVVESPRRGVEIECRDRGPGIHDAERAFEDGVSRSRKLAPEHVGSSGMGLGLGAVRRLMDEVIIAQATVGAQVVARRWLRGQGV
jgi:serine/threonine-protein kinase RsbT